MKVFFVNAQTNEEITEEQALEASVEQALEIFTHLPQDGGSFLGILNENEVCVRIRKFNRFMWQIEIPVSDKNGRFVFICNRNQCRKFIDKIFENIDPFLLAEFYFESD